MLQHQRKHDSGLTVEQDQGQWLGTAEHKKNRLEKRCLNADGNPNTALIAHEAFGPGAVEMETRDAHNLAYGNDIVDWIMHDLRLARWEAIAITEALMRKSSSCMRASLSAFCRRQLRARCEQGQVLRWASAVPCLPSSHEQKLC
jgi:hypothetical protein